MSDITSKVISSWNLGGSQPTITGDPSKTRFEIRGFESAGTAIMRSGDEPISLDDPHAASFVRRALGVLGTGSAWQAIY